MQTVIDMTVRLSNIWSVSEVELLTLNLIPVIHNNRISIVLTSGVVTNHPAAYLESLVSHPNIFKVRSVLVQRKGSEPVICVTSTSPITFTTSRITANQ